VWETDLRIYFAPLVLVLALAFGVAGARRAVVALQLPAGATGKNLRLMSGFRLAIVGAAVACTAAAWLVQSVGLAVAAALIGVGELMETSLDVWALRREVEVSKPASAPAGEPSPRTSARSGWR
jgi:hypothetical protein